MFSHIVEHNTLQYFETSGRWFGQYLKHLEKTDTGDFVRPTRIDPKRWSLGIKVIRAERWPLVVAVESTGIILAAPLAEAFQQHSLNEVQILPVDLSSPKRFGVPPEYFMVNFLREEDVLNFSHTSVAHSQFRTPLQLEKLVIEGEMAIDAGRLTTATEAFVVKYTEILVVGARITAALMKLRTKGFRLEPIRDVPEAEPERKAILRRLEDELGQRSVVSTEATVMKTVGTLEKLLHLKLPTTAKKYFAEPPEIEDCSTELFDLSRAAEETQRLRDWKELQWPTELVCISEDGRGGYWALDTGKVKAGDCPVMYFDHELADVDPKTGTITPNLELAAPTLKAWIKGLEAGGTGLPQLKPTRGKDASSSRSKTARNKAQKPASKKSKAKAKKKR